MSSKVIRSGDPGLSRVSAWSPGQNSGAIAQWPAGPQADVNREWEARVKAAYQQGLAAGQASGIQQASERIEPAAASFNRIVDELSSLRKKFRAEVEEDTVKIAIAIARRILHRELVTDSEAILGLVIAAFQRLNARETQRLRLSPADAQIVQEHRAKLDFPQALEIAADPSLVPGSAVFETLCGELDASVDTQFAEIQRGFTDLVKRRAR